MFLSKRKEKKKKKEKKGKTDRDVKRKLAVPGCRFLREGGGVHLLSAADRFRDGGGGLLAVGQLLVPGAGRSGHPGIA